MALKLTYKMTHATFVYLVEASNSNKDFILSRTEACKLTGLAKATYYKAIDELLALNLIHKANNHYYLGGNPQ